MIAFAISGATLLLVGAMVVSLERHRKLTPLTALLTGLGTIAIVLGAITTSLAAAVPSKASISVRGVSDVPLVVRVIDIELPTL